MASPTETKIKMDCLCLKTTQISFRCCYVNLYTVVRFTDLKNDIKCFASEQLALLTVQPGPLPAETFLTEQPCDVKLMAISKLDFT